MSLQSVYVYRRFRILLEEYKEELFNFINAYLISLIPFLGGIFGFGYSKETIKEGYFHSKIFKSFKKGILPYLVYLALSYFITLFSFFSIRVFLLDIREELIMKFPEIFLPIVERRVIYVLFLRRAILIYLLLALSIYSIRDAFSLKSLYIFSKKEFIFFYLFLVVLFTFLDNVYGIYSYDSPYFLKEFPFLFIFFRVFSDEVRELQKI